MVFPRKAKVAVGCMMALAVSVSLLLSGWQGAKAEDITPSPNNLGVAATGAPRTATKTAVPKPGAAPKEKWLFSRKCTGAGPGTP